MKPAILAVAALMLIAPATAHQPVLSEGAPFTAEEPYEIEQPEISKALFGELTGEPHFYRIRSDEPFDFYAGITVPKIDDCPLETRFSFDVLDENLAPITTANGQSFDWWPWYEEFGKKWYWVGPEIGEDFQSNREYAAGTYYIRVFNPDNSGRYVLAVGDIEDFPIDVIVRTMFTLPGINAKFWDDVTCEAAEQ